MNKSKKKLQKEKARKKRVAEKLRVRREAGRVAAKEEREEKRAQDKFEREQAELIAWEEAMESAYSSLPPETRKQLMHNIEILKALEEEHEQEIARKQKLNQTLEEEGHITPESKMKALQDSAIEKQKAESAEEEISKAADEKQIGMGGSADCSFKASNS